MRDMKKSMKIRIARLRARFRAVAKLMRAPFFEVVTVNAQEIGCQGWMPPKIVKALDEALEDVKIGIMREVEEK